MENEMKEQVEQPKLEEASTDVTTTATEVETVEETQVETVEEKPKEDIEENLMAMVDDSDNENNEPVSNTALEAEDIEVELDDLSDTAPSEIFQKISVEDKEHIPEALTIESVRLGKPQTRKSDGTAIPPLVSTNGEYYKAKLIVEFKEEINGKRIREFVPSIFYSVKNNQIQVPPSIPQACKDEEMDNKFTKEISVLRNKYCKFVGKEIKDVSNVEFAKGLIGKKIQPKFIQDKWKNPETGLVTEYTKLKIENFVE